MNPRSDQHRFVAEQTLTIAIEVWEHVVKISYVILSLIIS